MNGLETKGYRFDSDEPSLELLFADFAFGNTKFEQLGNILASGKIANSKGYRRKESRHLNLRALLLISP
jgi:hypothetical protein